MTDRHYDSEEGEFVDFATLDEWRARDLEKDARIATLQADNERLREVLQTIIRTPSRPFPDAGAHSFRAWGLAVFQAWKTIQHIARTALTTEEKNDG